MSKFNLKAAMDEIKGNNTDLALTKISGEINGVPLAEFKDTTCPFTHALLASLSNYGFSFFGSVRDRQLQAGALPKSVVSKINHSNIENWNSAITRLYSEVYGDKGDVLWRTRPFVESSTPGDIQYWYNQVIFWVVIIKAHGKQNVLDVLTKHITLVKATYRKPTKEIYKVPADVMIAYWTKANVIAKLDAPNKPISEEYLNSLSSIEARIFHDLVEQATENSVFSYIRDNTVL